MRRRAATDPKHYPEVQWTGKSREAGKLTRQRIRRLLIKRYGYAEGRRIWRKQRGLDDDAGLPIVFFQITPITASQFEGRLTHADLQA